MEIPQNITVRQKHSFVELRHEYNIFDVDSTNKKTTPFGKIVNSTFFLYRILHIIISNSWLGFSYTVFDKNNKVIGTLQKPGGPTNVFNILDKDNTRIATTSVSRFSSDFTIESTTGWRALVTRNGRDFTIAFPKSLNKIVLSRKPRNILLNVFFPHSEYVANLKGIPKGLEKDEAFFICIACIPLAMNALAK